MAIHDGKTPNSNSSLNTPQTFFFYGTLMAPSVLQRVTSHNILYPQQHLTAARPAILHNHRRHRVKGADYPAVVPSHERDACVKGAVVSGIMPSDVWRLDTFEGDEYERRRLRVTVLPPTSAGAVPEIGTSGATTGASHPGEAADSEAQRDEEIEAETYIWTAPLENLEDQEWDYDEFVKEKMWRWAGGQGDSGFEDVERAAQERDPTGGRSVNGGFERAVEGAGGQGEHKILEGAV